MDRFLELEKKAVEERLESFRSIPVTDVEVLKKGGILQRYAKRTMLVYN